MMPSWGCNTCRESLRCGCPEFRRKDDRTLDERIDDLRRNRHLMTEDLFMMVLKEIIAEAKKA